jgi:hypothetical protein
MTSTAFWSPSARLREHVDRYAAQYQAELDHLRGVGPDAPSVAKVTKRVEMRQRATALDSDRA